jgi:hypothetical protein
VLDAARGGLRMALVLYGPAEDITEAVRRIGGLLDSVGEERDAPAPANPRAWRPGDEAVAARLLASSTQYQQAVLRHLAERPDVWVSNEELGRVIGRTEQGAAQLGGVFSWFQKRCEAVGREVPYENGWKRFRMTGVVAAVFQRVGGSQTARDDGSSS